MIGLLHILEDIDLDTISNTKSFKNLPSNLVLISKRGTTRDVYEYNNNYVLKIAKNKKGLEQNKNEVEKLTKYNSSLFPKLKKYDKKNYRYIVVEKVNDFKTGREFYKSMFPEFENIFIKFKDFYDKYYLTYFIPDYRDHKFGLFTREILPSYLTDKSISFISRTEFDTLHNQNKDLFNTNREKFYSLADKNQVITFMTSKDINDLLDKNINAQNIKKIYKSGLHLKDLHWKNFGYVDDQLKIIDLGI